MYIKEFLGRIQFQCAFLCVCAFHSVLLLFAVFMIFVVVVVVVIIPNMHDMCSSIGCWGGVYTISLIEYKLMNRYTIYTTLISILVQNASKEKVLFLIQNKKTSQFLHHLRSLYTKFFVKFVKKKVFVLFSSLVFQIASKQFEALK